MANYLEPLKETEKIFDGILVSTGLDNVINVKILTNDKLKEIGDVKKTTPLIKHLTGYDVIVLVNEPIFDVLSDVQKQISAETILAKIYYNYEKDRVKITKPDFSAFSLILEKYGYENCKNLDEAIKLAAQQSQEQTA